MLLPTQATFTIRFPHKVAGKSNKMQMHANKKFFIV